MLEDEYDRIRIGLLSRGGQVPTRSGLNWGQRPGRNGNESYIAIPVQHARANFFPEIGQSFRTRTDSGFILSLVRCQQGGKALQSLPHNQILGRYLRERLGVATGLPISKAQLIGYGRTDIEFVRLNNAEYFLNFGVGS